MKKFRSLYTTEFDEKSGKFKRIHEVGNIRHLQHIGSRRVYTSAVEMPIMLGLNTFTVSVKALGLSVFVMFIFLTFCFWFS
jgi:hypothetical protein